MKNLSQNVVHGEVQRCVDRQRYAEKVGGRYGLARRASTVAGAAVGNGWHEGGVAALSVGGAVDAGARYGKEGFSVWIAGLLGGKRGGVLRTEMKMK